MQKKLLLPGMLVPACNPSPWEAEAGGSSQVGGQSVVYNQTVKKGKLWESACLLVLTRSLLSWIVLCENSWPGPEVLVSHPHSSALSGHCCSKAHISSCLDDSVEVALFLVTEEHAGEPGRGQVTEPEPRSCCREHGIWFF